MARQNAKRYRRKGLLRTARGLVEAAGDVAGATVLDIGGGIGTIGLELLERGAARATTVEISAGYEDAAAELAAEHRLSERVDRRIGDFVAEADLVDLHDVVLLHRVVCCYPDAAALVEASARRTRTRLLLTYPRRQPFIRLGVRAVNVWLRLTRCGFRMYAHPFAAIASAAEREGLVPAGREAQGIVWENAAFERVPAGAGVRP